MDHEQRLRTAAEDYETARIARDNAIRAAARGGHTRRAIAAIVGLSHQRIQQIIHETRPKNDE